MLYWIIGALGVLAVATLLIAYVCYRMAFYEPPRNSAPSDEITYPDGDIYLPFRESMRQWTLETRAMPREEFSIRSHDNLKLYANFYEFAPGAPIEIMFHGYRGSAERDLSGGVQRCFKLGRSCLLVDQRCSGKSGGNTITFGINEHRDCLKWVKFAVKHFGPDVKLILTGISMGAATVLMAAGHPLPKNVIGVLADCSYSSPKEIIKTVIRQKKLPAVIAYPFVYLGGRLFGRFDLEDFSPLAAMEKCSVPVIFFHGDTDDYVPCSMSRELYDACAAKKQLVIVPNAGHGLSYPIGGKLYLDALRNFFGKEASYFDGNFLDGPEKM